MDDKSKNEINFGHGAAVNGSVSIDSHNIINEAQKTAEQVEQDRRIQFYKEAMQAMPGGKLDTNQESYLEGLRLQLNLSPEVAHDIIEQIRKSNLTQHHEKMDFIAEQLLQQVIGAIFDNQVELLRKQNEQMQALNQNSSNEMVNFFSYLLQATFTTQNFIAQCKNSRTDNYWQKFWGCVAALKQRDYHFSHQLLVELQTWNRHSGDLALLMALENQSQYRDDLKSTYYRENAIRNLQSLDTTSCHDFLEFTAEALKAIVHKTHYEPSLAFYTEQVFAEFAITEANESRLEIEQLYAKAVRGDADAQYALGGCYYQGKELPRDMNKAFYWFSAAANQGFPAASANLGQCYEYGLGTQVNLPFAARYYREGGREDLAAAVEQRLVQLQAAQKKMQEQPIQSIIPGVGAFLKPGQTSFGEKKENE